MPMLSNFQSSSEQETTNWFRNSLQFELLKHPGESCGASKLNVFVPETPRQKHWSKSHRLKAILVSLHLPLRARRGLVNGHETRHRVTAKKERLFDPLHPLITSRTQVPKASSCQPHPFHHHHLEYLRGLPLPRFTIHHYHLKLLQPRQCLNNPLPDIASLLRSLPRP